MIHKNTNLIIIINSLASIITYVYIPFKEIRMHMRRIVKLIKDYEHLQNEKKYILK